MSTQGGFGTANIKPAAIIPSDIMPVGFEVTATNGSGDPTTIVCTGVDAYSRTITITINITYDVDGDPSTFVRSISGDDASDNPAKTWTVTWPNGKSSAPKLVVS